MEDIDESNQNTEPTNPQVDDLILDAQDAYFEGDLTKVINSCEKAIELSPREAAAYDLLSMALLQLNPPSYTKASSLAVEWGKRCRETPKQLFMGLKSCYHTDNLTQASEFATKLIRFKDEMLNNALAAALISDLGDVPTGRKLAQTCSGQEEEFDDEDMFGLLKMTVLLAWVDIKSENAEKGVKVLRELTTQMADSDDWPIGLAYSLLILHEIEQGTLEQASNYLQQAENNNLKSDDHIVAVRALYKAKENGEFSKEEATLCVPLVTPILRKRLEKILK